MTVDTIDTIWICVAVFFSVIIGYLLGRWHESTMYCEPEECTCCDD